MIKISIMGDKLNTKIQDPIVKEIQRASYRIPAEIGRRVRSGRNAQGGSNRKYSEKYLKYRKKRGRSGNPVRLYFTGHMLNSIQKYNIFNGAKIAFNNALAGRLAVYHEYGRHKTPFFDITRRQKADITMRVSRRLDRESAKSISFSLKQ